MAPGKHHKSNDPCHRPGAALASGVEAFVHGPRILLMLAGATALAVLPAAGGGPPGNPPKRTAAQPAVPPDGETLYRSYCASCHGLDGKGGGPAAEALRMRPTDLTTISARHGGQFPARRLQRMLGGEDGIAAHGGRQMPAWGPAFSSLCAVEGKPGDLAARLLRYLQSIQQQGGASAP